MHYQKSKYCVLAGLNIRILISVAVLAFVSVCSLTANPLPQSINKRSQELKNLNKSIESTRKKINRLSRKEKSEIKALNTYQKHISQVKRYLGLLNEEIEILQDSIDHLSSLLNTAGASRGKVAEDFSRAAFRYYLKEKSNKNNLLFASPPAKKIAMKSMLKDYSIASKYRYNEISRFMDSTQLIVKLLYEQSIRHEELRTLKDEERKKLNSSIQGKRKLLKSIKSNKTLLKKQLRQKQQSAKSLKKIIASLSKKGKYASKSSTPPRNLPIGKLSWPVNSKRIYRKFGENRNTSTNTIFDNPGIDITIASGSPVTAAAGGNVSLTHWLPGYGSLVILDHGKDIRTVYANLSVVTVKKGDRIKKGQMIGRSGESIDGNILHFELWSGATKLNPANYLR